MSTPFPVLDLVAAAFAVNGWAASHLLQTAGLDPVEVEVDRRYAGAWFDVPLAPTRYQDVVERHGVHALVGVAGHRVHQLDAVSPTDMASRGPGPFGPVVVIRAGAAAIAAR